MNFNKQIIIEFMPKYKEMYYNKHNEQPTSWFSYLRWLGSFTPAGNFDNECIELVKKLLGTI